MRRSPLWHDSKTPFRHPLIKGLPGARDIKHLYAQERDGGVQIFQESYIRGDPVGSPTTGLETLRSESDRTLIWSLPLSMRPKHRCIIFAPETFDIGSVHQDLTLLYMLSQLGDYCGRYSFLEYWQAMAGILAGRVYGETQGWWHMNARVVVISCLNENYRLFSSALVDLLRLNGRRGGAILVEPSVELIESTFRKATALLFDEMKRFPWVDKHK